MRTRLALLTAAAVAAIAVAGCGEEEITEPASLVPSGASIYIEAVVRPEGDQADALEEALRAMTGREDIGSRIVAALDAELAEDEAGITYGEDIEPWLGERGAFFVAEIESAADLEEDRGQGGFLLEQTDDDAARETLEALAAAEPDVEEASTEGVDYFTDGEFAAGIVGDYLVFASDPLFGEIVELEADGGDALVDQEEFGSEVERLGEAWLARAWVDVPQFVDVLSASGEITSSERIAVDALFGPLFEQPLAAVAGVEADSIYLELSTGAAADPSAVTVAGGTDLLEALPQDSWLAFGGPDIGRSVQAALSELEAGEYPGVARVSEQFEARTGLELERLLAALGDAAIFARGTSLLEAGGGLVIEVRDPEVIEEALDAAADALARDRTVDLGPLPPAAGEAGFTLSSPEAPNDVYVALRAERLAVVYGDESAQQALDAEGGLAGSEAFAAARTGLGEDFDVGGFLDFAPLVELAAASPAGADPEFAQVRPFLENLAYLAIGTRVEEARTISRVVLGLE